ncbi:5-formyltetrahydrofolate cyclo-ligase, partial [Staphylococcus ureilyticus]|uniref:5-formyltetrahydrofolate cyclo-ligase n=1 Tax=Staphylococcus ureilyticus TaxID=94138 RepID=UPI0030C57C61
KHIRQATIEKLKSFNKDKKAVADLWLANELFNTKAYQDAESIGFVLSMTHEVDTYKIIETAIKQNKKVYVPETNYKEGLMTFKRLLYLNEIEKDDKG